MRSLSARDRSLPSPGCLKLACPERPVGDADADAAAESCLIRWPFPDEYLCPVLQIKPTSRLAAEFAAELRDAAAVWLASRARKILVTTLAAKTEHAPMLADPNLEAMDLHGRLEGATQSPQETALSVLLALPLGTRGLRADNNAPPSIEDLRRAAAALDHYAPTCRQHDYPLNAAERALFGPEPARGLPLLCRALGVPEPAPGPDLPPGRPISEHAIAAAAAERAHMCWRGAAPRWAPGAPFPPEVFVESLARRLAAYLRPSPRHVRGWWRRSAGFTPQVRLVVGTDPTGRSLPRAAARGLLRRAPTGWSTGATAQLLEKKPLGLPCCAGSADRQPHSPADCSPVPVLMRLRLLCAIAGGCCARWLAATAARTGGKCFGEEVNRRSGYPRHEDVVNRELRRAWRWTVARGWATTPGPALALAAAEHGVAVLSPLYKETQNARWAMLRYGPAAMPCPRTMRTMSIDLRTFVHLRFGRAGCVQPDYTDLGTAKDHSAAIARFQALDAAARAAGFASVVEHAPVVAFDGRAGDDDEDEDDALEHLIVERGTRCYPQLQI